MRALVDIPRKQIEELAAICEGKGVSRAEAIRQAIACYIEKNKPVTQEAFALWKAHAADGEDGMDYQRRMRDEW